MLEKKINKKPYFYTNYEDFIIKGKKHNTGFDWHFLNI